MFNKKVQPPKQPKNALIGKLGKNLSYIPRTQENLRSFNKSGWTCLKKHNSIHPNSLSNRLRMRGWEDFESKLTYHKVVLWQREFSFLLFCFFNYDRNLNLKNKKKHHINYEILKIQLLILKPKVMSKTTPYLHDELT